MAEYTVFMEEGENNLANIWGVIEFPLEGMREDGVSIRNPLAQLVSRSAKNKHRLDEQNAY